MEALNDLTRRVFGIPSLRPLQGEAMQAMLAGRDSLLVLPTGGGKSLTFQAPALLLEGTTLVISPLISLMQDQVRGLKQNGVRAAMLGGGLSAKEHREVLRQLHDGALDLLYVAPERLVADAFLARLSTVHLAALVVDEAHCISHWGHAFRPEYREIARVREAWPDLSIHACTATATARVREDISAQLELRDPLELVGSFDRPNLTYRFHARTNRRRQVAAILNEHRGQAAIVYALRRADVDQIAAELTKEGHRVRAYHAGLDDRARRDHQEDFLNEDCDVVVATVAFGMGIDRPDVRLVLHAAMPKSIEHYLQESGRAGRDNEPANCTMLYAGSDYHGWRGLIEQGSGDDDSGPALERLGEMYTAASSTACRHRLLAGYFGQELEAKSCGACDVCLKEIPALPEATDVARKILSCVYRVGQRFGGGYVTEVLRGSRNERVLQRGHDEISTFGLLKDLDAATVRSAIDQLLGQGFLRASGEEYPVLRLTDASAPILRGEAEVELFAAPRPSKGKGGGAKSAPKPSLSARDLGPADAAVFESLRELRHELATKLRVRPYMIFSDATLAELSRSRPRDRDAFLQIKGIGEKKADTFADTFLQRLREQDLDESA